MSFQSTSGTRKQRSTARSTAWRGRNQNQRSQRRSRDTSAYVTKASLSGGRVKVPTNPPDLNFQPWNHVTLVDAFTAADREFKINDIVKLLRSQLDPNNRGFKQGDDDNGLIVQLRFFEVMAWNLTGRMIAMSVTDFSETNSAVSNREQLCGLVDTGAQGHIPAVGYLMPAMHRATVLRNDKIDRDVVLFNIQCGMGDACVFYLKCAFRFDGPVKIPKFMSTVGLLTEQLVTARENHSVAKDIAVNTKKSQTTLGKVKNTLSDIVSAMPDTIKIAKDGITLAAQVVTAIAEVEDERLEAGGSPFESVDAEMLAEALQRL